MSRTWSAQQDAIFSYFVDAFGNLVVRARAGTGKTTTIIEAVKRWLAANPGKTVLVCAFNKRIAEELVTKFGLLFGISQQVSKRDLEVAVAAKGVVVKTLHAVGYACARRFREHLVIEDAQKVDVLRKDALALRACGRSAPDAILRLVAKLHTLGRETAPHAKVLGDLTALQIAFECEPDEQWTEAGYDAAYVERYALEAMELASRVQNGDTIDFSDMIFLPVRNGWLVSLHDLVVVDEAQDMTTAQLEIAVGVAKKDGRIAVVGDDRQAIYSFRGADSGSLDRLKIELNAAELGLTTTYRCGKAIVELAKAYVPDFEAGVDNPDGLIRSIAMDDGSPNEYGNHATDVVASKGLISEAGPGDFVLSRVNAPLVGTAMRLLRAGKRTRVAGKDIGKGLVALIRKLRGRSVPDLLAKIEAWAARENARHAKALAAATNGRKTALKAKMEAVLDQADMLASLADGAKNVDEVTDRIEGLFTDDGLGAAGVITCSSVHRAKGLEAERVFILRDTLRDTSDEERNICYVAITRAKRELVWVTKPVAV